jgi:alginate O-acetyltransferase complex protein AlgJ
MPIDPHSRETEALAEIAATRLGRGARAALAGGALALLAAGFGLEAAAALRGSSALLEPMPAGERLSGSGPRAANRELRRAFAELERRFDEESVLARAIRPWGQLALTALAGYGNEEAIAGRGGWLAFRGDFDHLTLAEAPRRALDPVEAAEGFASDLAARGISLLVLLAPAKPAIQPAPFTRPLAVEALADERSAAFAAAAAERGVPVLDPSGLLGAAARGAPVFLATDTHWRPEGMETVAREAAVMLRALAELPVGDPDAWRVEPQIARGRGDAAVLLGLPAGRELPGEAVEVARTVDPSGAPWRGSRGAPVLLLGDSFSAIYSRPELGFGAGGGFAERLADHLGLPVDRILRNSGGASETRAALAAELARDPRRLDGVRAVVWQLAARELTLGTWVATPLVRGDRQSR